MLSKNFYTKSEPMNHPQKDIKAILGRINVRMVEIGMQPADLNRLLDMSPGWFHNIEKREGKSLLNYIDGIARVLKCNPIWLLYGDEYPKESLVSHILRLNKTFATDKEVASEKHVGKISAVKPLGTPILYLYEIDDWKNKTEELVNTTREKIILDTSIYDPDCFGIFIDNDINYPKFNVGDVVIINPNIQPKPGAYIAVKLSATGQNIFAQYNIQDAKIVLKFLNEQYSDILVKKEDIKVIGVAVRTQQQLFH